MPIDLDRVVGARLGDSTYSWVENDLILYNLGVGAGVPPTEPAELKYAYEAELVAVPTFGTIPPFASMMEFGAIGGLEIHLGQVLHGDHRIEIHGPIPRSGTVQQRGRVAGVHDKGSGALLVLEVVSTLVGSASPLFTNRAGIFVRGEGGFGGERGPSTGTRPPQRSPDYEVDSTTLPQQALWYRMASGDKNPLHADPAFAELAGFERPILHGLCTYGIVCKALVETGMDGDPGRLGTLYARFSGHVFPGETVVTQIWDEGDHLVVGAATIERGKSVLVGVATPRS